MGGRAGGGAGLFAQVRRRLPTVPQGSITLPLGRGGAPVRLPWQTAAALSAYILVAMYYGQQGPRRRSPMTFGTMTRPRQ